MKKNKKLALVAFFFLTSCSTTKNKGAISFMVQVNNPVKGKVIVAPFINENQNNIFWRGRSIDFAREFENYLRSLLRTAPGLRVLPKKEIELPSRDPLLLWREEKFWAEVAQSQGADYVIAGAVEVDVPQYEVEGGNQISKPLSQVTLTVLIMDKNGKLVKGTEIRFTLDESEKEGGSFSTSPFHTINFPKEKIRALFFPIQVQAVRNLL